jgi:hypothetical protein
VEKAFEGGGQWLRVIPAGPRQATTTVNGTFATCGFIPDCGVVLAVSRQVAASPGVRFGLGESLAGQPRAIRVPGAVS